MHTSGKTLNAYNKIEGVYVYHLPWVEQPEHPTQSHQSQAMKSSSQPKQDNNSNINKQQFNQYKINMYACMNDNTTRCISVIWLEMTILLHVKLYWWIQGSAQFLNELEWI